MGIRCVEVVFAVWYRDGARFKRCCLCCLCCLHHLAAEMLEGLSSWWGEPLRLAVNRFDPLHSTCEWGVNHFLKREFAVLRLPLSEIDQNRRGVDVILPPKSGNECAVHALRQAFGLLDDIELRRESLPTCRRKRHSMPPC